MLILLLPIAWTLLAIGGALLVVTFAWMWFRRLFVAGAVVYLLYGWARVGMLALLTMLLGGCISMDGPEYAYQAVHAIDIAQTYQVAQSKCGRTEVDGVTSAVIGSTPTKGAVIAWGVGTAYAHAWVSDYLRVHDYSQTTRDLWQLVTITITVGTVSSNYGNGISPTGENC